MAVAVVSRTQSAGARYPIGRPRGVCHATGREIAPSEPMVAALRVVEGAYERLDFLPEAWDSLEATERDGLLAYWYTAMPSPNERRETKGPAVDIDVLAELFERLEDENNKLADRVAFRFVVGLMLMRKKRLTFISTETADDQEVWRLRWRGGSGGGVEVTMVSPHLDEAALAEVGQRVEALLHDGADGEAEGGSV